ncbi:MAG: hypothetical protein AB8B95_05440 [Pseudohongiellaceae bacterium]
MSLADKLNEIKQGSVKRIPANIAEIMTRATDDLRVSGIMERVIKVGAKMPDFTLLNQSGTPISSAVLLQKGALVLTVFRGGW